jgi:hypothetical protein
VAFEENSEDVNLKPVSESDLAIMYMRLRISAVEDAFDNRKVGGTSSCSSCRYIDHSGTLRFGRIKPPSAVAVGCLAENK